MAQSYTRQSSMSDGDTITAALFNDEYNQLVNAFTYSSSSASSTGHRHDGTAGHGGNIHTIGDLDFLNKIVADSTNNRWGFFVEVSSAAVEQIRIQDGAIVPVTDNDIDLGTSSLEFKDAYFDGTVTTDLLTVSGTTNLDGAIQVDNTITVGVDDTGYDVKFFGDTASAYMLWDTSADDLVLAGAAGLDVAGDIDVDGTSNLDNTDIDGTLAVDGTTISLDATTSLNIDNSNTSNGITIGTATSGVPVSIGHTTSEVTVNDNLTVTGTLTLGSGAELTEAELEMLDGITAGTVAASKAVVVDSNKDAASFRNITLTGEIDAATLDISGDADIDGTLEADAITVDGTALNEYIADTVGAMVSSNTESGITVAYEDGDNTLDFTVGTLNQDTTGTADNITVSANNSTDETVYPIFVDGATGSQGAESDTGLTYNPSTGLLTSTGFSGNLTGTLQTAAQTNVTSLGTLTTLTVDDITINGSTISDGGDLTLDVAGDIILDAAGGEIKLYAAGEVGHISMAANDVTIKNAISDKDIIFQGNDGGSTITALTLDMSAAGAATFNDKIIATELDISGNADIDGTLEADAITVDGTALNEYIADTVGAMVGSNTETGITVTYEDGDNTLDFVIGTLNQNTTGNAATATLASTVTVSDSTANTNFPVVFHDESNALLDDTGALRYNPSTGELLVPKLTVAGTTTTADTVTMQASNAIVFEGATADSNETTLSIVDPTSDHTQYLINQGGYIPVLAAATTTQISSTPAELNLLDGSTANTVVNSKAVIYGSSGELAGTLSTAAQTNVTSLGTLTTLTVDDITINGSTISDGGDLTVDVTGVLNLDATTQIILKDDGTNYGTFYQSSNDFYIQSLVQDKDIVFYGNDGGSGITALTLDMSSAGAATFNSSVNATNYLVGGAQGSDGQVLTSTGSGVAWEDASGGSFNADGAQTFNDSGAAVDFRIESDSDANMFFLDGSANAIGMGTSAPNEGGFGSGSRVLSIQGSSQDDFGVLELISPDVTSSNRIGEIRFGNLDAGSSFASNAGMRATRDGADNSSALSLWATNAGTFSERFRIDGTGHFTFTGKDANSNQLIFKDSGGAVDGYLYTEAGEIGFLDGDGQWGYKLVTDTSHAFSINNSERVKIIDSGPVMTITEAGTDGYETLLKLYRSSTSANEVGIQFDVNGSGGSGQAVGMWAAKGEDWSSGTSRSATLNIQCKDDGTDQNMYQFGNFSDGVNQHKWLTEGAERMRLDQNGVLLLGTTSAISNSVVTVHGGDMMVVGDNNNAGVSDLLPGYTRGDYGTFYSSANNLYFVVGSSYVSYINGSNGTYNVSDERLKENINTLTGTLDKVKQLRGVSFTWKDTETKGTDTTIGLIAQEVETIYPELVGDGGLPKDTDGNDALKSVNYAHLTAVLIEAVKELNTKLEAAEARITTLEG